MSNYTKITNYTSKDALPSGNASKVVRGTELDNEFAAVASAVATKADTLSPPLTGTPTAPTAIAGTSTTQLATTAFATATAQALYPVGSIYINASVATNPATLLGFGTWIAFAAGRVLVGLDSTNAAFDAAEETGGSSTAITVSHTHTYNGITEYMKGGVNASHNHSMTTFLGNLGGPSTAYVGDDSGFGGSTPKNTSTVNIDHVHDFSGTTAGAGGSGTNANLQPYIVVYMWKRTV
jgi:hypothetical protein